MAFQPIGVFDSGLGGLTVLTALRARLPDEDFIYFADMRFSPYGNRDEAFILTRGRRIARALATEGVKAVVIACNTASVVASETVRSEIRLPVIALEPAVKPAVTLTRTKVVGVLATTRTILSQRFQRLTREYSGDVHLIAQPCPGLAEAIESEGAKGSGVAALLDEYVSPLVAAGADVVVLGCTHYPWVRAGIAERFPEGVTIIDSGEAVARQLERRLRNESYFGGNGNLRLVTSGNPHETSEMVVRLLGSVLPVEAWHV